MGLKKAPRGVARAAVAPGSDLFDTGAERRWRNYRNLVMKGYPASRARELSGLTAEDLGEFVPPRTELKKPPP